MKIAVCVKAVPDAAAGRRLDPATKRLDRSGELAISEFDTYAVEEALKLRDASGDGEVVVVSMGPERAMDALRKGAMGAKKRPQEPLAATAVGGAVEPGTTVSALNPPPPRGEAQKIDDDGSAAEKIVAFLAEKRLV